MASTPRQPRQISERVFLKWEYLVYRAIVYAERKAAAASNLTVPQTLQQANIESILQAAEEIGEVDLDVARILLEYAFIRVQGLDPNSEGRGVLQFKIRLLSVIEQQRSGKEGEKIDRSHDVHILQEFYHRFREQLEQLEYKDNMRRHSDSYEDDSTTTEQRAEGRRKMYLIAKILNDVVDSLNKDGAKPKSSIQALKG